MTEKTDSLGAWKTLSERSEIDSRWLKVNNVTYELPNGEIVEDYYIVEKPSVVVVVPIRDNQTYLIKEYERGVSEVGYKLPGGRIDNEESPETAAKRELAEEVGLVANSIVSLGETHVDPGLMPTKAHYFLCEDFEERHNEKMEDAKELFVGEWVDLSEVADKIRSNEIKNSFVITAYALASGYLAKKK